MPVLSTPNNPRNFSYPWNKKQQRLINTKSPIILRITRPKLTRHYWRNKLGLNSEQQKWPLTKKVTIRRNWLSLTWTFSTKTFKIVCQTFNMFGKVELSALFRSFPVCWEPTIVNWLILIARRRLCRPTGCRSASDAHFRFNYTSDNRQMIIIFIIIAQLIYLIFITYFRHEHHVEVVQGKMSRWPIRCLVTTKAEIIRD